MRNHFIKLCLVLTLALMMSMLLGGNLAFADNGNHTPAPPKTVKPVQPRSSRVIVPDGVGGNTFANDSVSLQGEGTGYSELDQQTNWGFYGAYAWSETVANNSQWAVSVHTQFDKNGGVIQNGHSSARGLTSWSWFCPGTPGDDFSETADHLVTNSNFGNYFGSSYADGYLPN